MDLASIKHKHTPTEESNAFVLGCVLVGMNQDQIAATLGISDVTLRTYYREYLDSGLEIANAKVARKAYEMALSGDHPAMTMFWLKTRARWRETDRLEVTIQDMRQRVREKAVELGLDPDDAVAEAERMIAAGVK